MRPVAHAVTRAVLEFARAEAAGLDHNFVGSGHLLLGLLRGPNGHAAKVLAARTDLESVRTEVRELVPTEQSQETRGGSRDEDPTAHLPFSVHASEALGRARREAEGRRTDQITPEHLLMGVVQESEGTASKVLKRLDVNPHAIQQEVHEYWQSQGQSPT
jgi:ATP-dependent Clp protease ATP-binding subunit ClpC